MVTQQFHDTLEPLSEWLASTEKHLSNSEPVGTETSKLEDQISQHKVGACFLMSLFSIMFLFSTVTLFDFFYHLILFHTLHFSSF